MFRFFFWQKMKILRNRNFGNFEILEDFQNFEILKLSKFRFFKIFIFCQKKIWKYFSFFSKIFFVLKKKYFRKIFLPISIQNFPRIPKIVLRKPCDEPKHAKTSTIVCLILYIVLGRPGPYSGGPGTPPQIDDAIDTNMKYRIWNFSPPSVFFSYLSSLLSPSLSPNGAVCDVIRQIKKILTRNQEWKCLPAPTRGVGRSRRLNWQLRTVILFYKQ